MKSSLNFIFFCSLFVLVGCAEQSLEDRLPGLWQDKETGTVAALLHTGHAILTQEGKQAAFKYSVLEGDKIKFKLQGNPKTAQEIIVTVKIEGDKLLWKDPENILTGTYIKVQYKQR